VKAERFTKWALQEVDEWLVELVLVVIELALLILS